MRRIETYPYSICPLSGETIDEDLWNYRTHLVGLILSVFGFFYLIYSFFSINNNPLLFGIILYGLSQIFLFAASTVYHKQVNIKNKSVWRIVDHISIFFSLSGTFSPFVLGPFANFFGLEMFALLWSLAFIGSYLKIYYFERFLPYSLISYLTMAAVFVLQFILLKDLIPFSSLIYGIMGALNLLFAIGFFLWDKLPYNHTIWHIFVMVSAIFNFRSIYDLLSSY